MALDLIRDKTGERRVVRSRLGVAALLIVFLFAGLIGRVAYLQIAQYEHYSARSQDNRVRLAPVTPTRGLIFDRNGQILAENRPAFRLTIVPEQVEDIPELLDRLSTIITLSEDELEAFQRVSGRARGFQEIPLKLRLSDEEVAQLTVNRHRFPGVEVRPDLARHYPYEDIGAHVIGYVGRISEDELRARDRRQYRGTSLLGKTGIERSYEHLLRGEMGLEHIETNALGRPIAVLEREPPVPGQDLQLTLDIELQRIAEATLGDYRGAIVAMDPRDGAILALASQPGFNPNALVQGLDRTTFNALRQNPRQPLFNRALRGRYPPGSVVKPFLALAGVATGDITPQERIFCNGTYQLPNVERVWRDWKPEGHGHVDFIDSVAESCDIYFYELAHRMGIDTMHDWMTRFGFGLTTGIDLPGERSGVMPSRDWKRAAIGEPWYLGETINTGIGQGFTLATPLQMATSTAMLANRGRPVRPHLLAHSNTESSGPAVPVMKLDDEQLWQITIDSMIEVVHGERGTARAIGEDLDYQIAGKTGTAQVIGIGQDEEYDEETLDERFHDHALFSAFAPAKNPRIALAVVVENGGSGSQTAAPMARVIIDAWMEHLHEHGELAFLER